MILGRDMNADQTDVGPEVTKLLKAGIRHQVATGNTLVVAPGYSPDYPHQPRAYAEMMAAWLIAHGAESDKIIVCHADSFDTYGELCELRALPGADKSVLGFDWHLKRARLEAIHAGGFGFARSLSWVSVPGDMSRFDRLVEPLKLIKTLFPRRAQILLVRLYKRLVSKRTSY